MNKEMKKSDRLIRGFCDELGLRCRYEASKLGTLNNKNWSKVSLKTLLITPIRNGYSPVCPDQESGSWVLVLSALDGNGFNSDQKKPAPPYDQKIRDFLVSKGDFLVSRSNTFDKVGRAALVREKKDCEFFGGDRHPPHPTPSQARTTANL